MSNTAASNMKAYMLTSSTLTNEDVIKQEINTYGSFEFRKTTIYLMFVNLDAVNAQPITITYLSALRTSICLIFSSLLFLSTLLI